MPLTTSQEDALKQWAELRSLVDEALSVLGEIDPTGLNHPLIGLSLKEVWEEADSQVHQVEGLRQEE